ncbi:hypothetical protein GCM10009664_54740 [Kitasatospora gansuensis]
MRRRFSPEPIFTEAAWVREFHDVLDSADPGLSFIAAFRVEWRREMDRASLSPAFGDTARAVRGVAERIALQRTVLRCDTTEQDINHELRSRLPWRTCGIEIVSAHVSVHVDEHTLSSAERAARIGREMAIEELERHQVAARIRFMEEEILRTPAKARLYLMLEQTGHRGLLAPGIDVDQVVREVQQWRPDSTWVVVAQLLHTFVGNLTSADHQDLLHTLRALFLDYDAKELADRLPSAHGSPAPAGG